MKIITVTINPSLDRTLVLNYLNVGYHNYASGETRLSAAGRGMNIAGALHSLGANVEAFVLLGQDPSALAYEALLKEEGFPYTVVRHPGTTRSNLFLKDEGNDTETVIKEEGAEIDVKSIQNMINQIKERLEPDDYLVLAGSLPHGADDTTYAEFTRAGKEAGAKVTIYTEGDILREALKAEPNIVVLTQHQTERFFNYPVRVLEEVNYCADQFREMGANSALIMLANNQGAVLSNRRGKLLVHYPEDAEFVMRSGSLEALMAGYLAGRMKERPLDKALQWAAAAASYAASQVGHEFGTPDQLREHMREINVEEMPKEERERQDKKRTTSTDTD